jgi:predicted metalloendopeptidase
LRKAFSVRIDGLTWMTAETKVKAKRKLTTFNPKIGYPDQWRDYSALSVDRNDLWGNVLRATEFEYQRQIGKLGKPVDRNEWFMTPQTVNAYANPLMNEIVFPAAILQPPFFVPGADSAVNYCSIGAVIGHEITHGFDSVGRQFGPMGNLRDWWTPQATAEFKKRNDLLVAQYNQFQLLPGLKVDGALTLGENTADLGGITMAHAALHRALKGKPQPKVDGLSTDQRCFVAWSQLWIYKAREELIRVRAATDYHANSVVRGYAPLMNLDAFHKAFGTQPGDGMWKAPDDRIRIW